MFPRLIRSAATRVNATRFSATRFAVGNGRCLQVRTKASDTGGLDNLSEKEKQVREGTLPKMDLPSYDVDSDPPHIEALVDEILDLTSIEIAMLCTRLKEKLSYDDLPVVYIADDLPGGFAPGAGGAAAAAPVEEKTEFDLVLKGFDAKSKIKIIKEIRAITGLGLKEAKELVESAPKAVKKALAKEEADELAAKLKELGAEVELE